MLSKIVLKNFKSFKNETEIDFSRTKYKFLEDINVAESGVLKGIMFVGANASGKSNIIIAIKLLLDLLFREKDINSRIFKCLFSDKEEFTLDYYFNINKKEIRYLVINNPVKNVLSEKLYIDNNLLLDRMGLTARSSIIDQKENLYDENDLDNETLFLRTLYFNTKFAGNETLKCWFEYLQNSIYINAFDRKVISYGKDDLVLNDYLNTQGTDDINNFFNKHNFNQVIEYSKEFSDGKIKLRTGDDSKTVFFRREDIDTVIPYEEESLGNQTLLNILPSFINIINKKGILLVDEFSSGFHNELEELLIKYFMRNSESSQIFFVSHSTNILTTSILRPDQIYSVNFSGPEGSWLKRFSDEQPRLAQNIEKMYLSGVFEGLPNYDETE
ncbi:AAA family ATPase [Iocasia frigidifontis]|uniref:AAA family ATPase n=1 Tax=Iocasia fonsfrigidae TaxID=2682810 RepID=A0A8A7KBX4_9FIRM|nr:ATP-binding protein [Iocasia fonsfrigidae]QTL98951.1 AAA family ATPase [Iocasia fonsfrigidae]